MAKTTTTKTTPAVKAPTGSTRFWVVQQGNKYSILEGAAVPDLTVERGERSKVIHGSYDDRAGAEERARFLADHQMGEFVG